jgi:lysophospholipase L1-like esterase
MLKKNKLIHIVYLAVIFVLVAVIVVFAVNLYQKSGGALTDHQKYYQSKCESYKVQNTNLSKGQIVFVGDSITDLYPLDDYYADLDLAVYNRGIGGDTTTGVLNRLKESVFDLKPSKVVLMIGTNDINGNVETDKILQNYREILTRIQTELPTTKIYCISVIPQNLTLESYTLIKVNKTTPRILEINKQIKSIVSSKQNITYLDLFPLLADENNMLIEKYSDDGIHLNAEGFKVWTGLLKPYLVLPNSL